MSEVKVPLAVVVVAWEDEGIKTCQGAGRGLNSLGLQIYLCRVRENTRSAEENGFRNRRSEKFEAAARNTQVFPVSYLYAPQNLGCFLFTCTRIISPVAACVLTRVRGVGTGTGSVAVPRSRTWTGPRTRPELGDHLHHIGHGHLAGAHGLKALGERTVRVLLNV